MNSGKSDDSVPSLSQSEIDHSSDYVLNQEAKKLILHPTISLPILNMLDMLSVSLVVPLLNQYFLDAGVTSASQRELLSSLFSSSQIIGGFLMGGLLDVGILSRKHSLYLSFLGSSFSYALILYGGMKGLIVSRIVVGLVKQTNTISTSMISTYTTTNDRAIYMGRLTASTTLAFIVGPSIGGVLYKNVDKKAPAFLASILFIFNFILAAILLPNEQQKQKTFDKKQPKPDPASQGKMSTFLKNIKLCFSSKQLGSVIASLLVYNWISRATSYASMASYYEQMFDIEPHQRGYIRSYTNVLSFLFQTFFVRSTLQRLGDEYNAACIASFALALATLLEFSSSFYLFLAVICPIVAISNAILRLTLRSLVTLVAPKQLLGSVLAALDVLQNVAAVTVPFYRTALFQLMMQIGDNGQGLDYQNKSLSMSGDPDPIMWLKSSFLHWMIATTALCVLLLKYSKNGVTTVEEISRTKKNI